MVFHVGGEEMIPCRGEGKADKKFTCFQKSGWIGFHSSSKSSFQQIGISSFSKMIRTGKDVVKRWLSKECLWDVEGRNPSSLWQHGCPSPLCPPSKKIGKSMKMFVSISLGPQHLKETPYLKPFHFFAKNGSIVVYRIVQCVPRKNGAFLIEIF